MIFNLPFIIHNLQIIILILAFIVNVRVKKSNFKFQISNKTFDKKSIIRYNKSSNWELI